MIFFTVLLYVALLLSATDCGLFLRVCEEVEREILFSGGLNSLISMENHLRRWSQGIQEANHKVAEN